MLKIFKKKPEQNSVIALDIGTEVTKAIQYGIEEKLNHHGKIIQKRAIIEGMAKVIQNKKRDESAITDIHKIIQSSKEAIQMASKKSKKAPTHLIMGIGGDIVKGGTYVGSYEREDFESKINTTELRNIIHKIQWKAFAETRKKLSEETGYPEIDIKLVNSFIAEIKIDGYKVSNPLGFQGKKVEIAIFNSFAPSGHYDALKNIADELQLEQLGIVSEPYALSKCLHLSEENISAIFIDIGGSATDIGVIVDNSIIETKTFGIGGRSFTKRLSVELNVSIEEADELKKAYAEEKLEQKSKKIISRIINEDMEIWLQGIVLTLSEFEQIRTLPSKIYLSGGGSYLTEFKKELSERKWHKKLNFKGRPQVNYLNPKNLRGIIDETKSIKGREDIMPLALVSLGLELKSEETISQKLLKKVIGIMQV